MSRRHRATLSPSLFPFLAVLVCTLGTLILLLALVAQKADETAEQAAREKAADQVDVEQAIANQQWMRTELVALRDQQTAVLERRRSELAHLEQRQRELREELKRLKEEMESAEQPDVDRTALAGTISALKAEIEAEQAKLEIAKKEANGRRPRVIITAHEGPYGTQRRPIYIECAADAVVLHPEGSRIEAEQLADALGPGNPLDAALRAIRLHWQKTEPDAPAPYPLLVVRPDGIQSYAAARRAMASWDDQFGYELVPSEVELAFPQPDPRLRHEIDVAIRESLDHQRTRIAAATRGARRGFGSPRRRPVLSAAALARGGTGGGSYFNRSVSPEESTAGSSLHPDDVRDFDNAMKAAAASAPSPGSAADVSGGLSEFASGKHGASSAFSSAGSTGTTAENAFGSDAAGQRQPGGGTAGPGMAGPGMAPGQSRSFADRQGAGNPAGTDALLQGSGGGFSQSGSWGASDEGTAAGTEGSATGRAASSGGPTAGQNGPGGPNASGAASPSSSASGSNGSSSASAGNSQQTTTQGKRLQRTGRDWALPDNVRRARGSSIERRIEILCRPDAFLMAPDRAGTQPAAYSFNGSAEEAAMGLAAAVHNRVESWGVALANGRWEPVLHVTVQPGAEASFQQLQAWLRGSGLKIEQR